MNNSYLPAAREYASLGLSVIPVHPANHQKEEFRKRPTCGWKQYQDTIASGEELQRMFHSGVNIALIAGEVSGNLEVLDFDLPELFPVFCDTLEGIDQGLHRKLLVQSTPSGGFHCIYQCIDTVEGNQKLAMSKDGKEVYIETRGQGGYFLVHPSEGYLLSATLDQLQTITREERGTLLQLARSFDERPMPEEYKPTPLNMEAVLRTSERPGDVFNELASWGDLLAGEGWHSPKSIDNRTHWTRPGKKAGTSATVHPEKGLYVFTSSTNLPIEQAIDKFGFIVRTKFNGDFKEASRWVTHQYPDRFPAEKPSPGLSVNSANSANSVNSASISHGQPRSSQGSAIGKPTTGYRHPNISQIGDEVRQFINFEPEPFTNKDVYSELCVNSPEGKKAVRNTLAYLEKQGKIRKIEGKRGGWEIVEEEPEAMDLMSADTIPINILLPLDISRYVNVRPGSIILVSGSNNAGKTLFLLAVAKGLFGLHQHTPQKTHTSFSNEKEKRCASKIIYLNSEMSKAELRGRIERFGDNVSLWMQKVSFYERSHSFDRLIQPDAVNLVDYLEVNEDFFMAGKMIADIHKKLQNGIAVIAMQKKQGHQFAKGGEMTLEKPRLAINLDKNEPHGFICKVTKAKEPVDFTQQIQGMERDYIITKDSRILPISDWRFVSDKQRRSINTDYSKNRLPEKVRNEGKHYKAA